MLTHALVGVGSGTPIIIFHGWAALLRPEQSLFSRLAERFTLCFIYLPGYNGTPDNNSSTSLPQIIEEVDQLVQKLGFTRFHLLGFSMGAQIATHYATMYPEKVEKLVLIGARPPEKQRAWQNLLSRVPGLVSLSQRIPWLEYVIVNRGFAFAQQLTPGREKKNFEVRNITVRGAFNSLVAQLAEYQNPFTLEQPVLFIYGELDKMQPKKLPNKREVIIVPQAGHSVFNENNSELAQKITQFLKE